MKDFWVSISALENAYGKDGKSSGCVRRWWLDKICKLPQPARPATIFGDVFHAVQARFYLADDRGLDETGQPVNLYPDGWKSVKSKFAKTEEVVGTISDLDETLIRTLVDKAITDGFMIREPGRLVECKRQRTLYIDPITGQKIVWIGYIDLETYSSVEDHKTAKSTRYIVSVKKLKTNVQMMMYGYDKYERGHSGDLWLRHNNYIKDYGDPQIIQRETSVTKEYVYDYYNTILLPRFKDMMKFSQRYPATEVERWRDLPPPNNSDKECNYHYGHSCPFIGICTGQCDVALYRAKYDSVRKVENNMGMIEDIKARNAKAMAAKGVVTPPTVTPPAASAPAPASKSNPMDILKKIQASKPAPAPAPEPVVPVDDRSKAPWHYPGCVACLENPYGGFNSKGYACEVCDAQSEQHGKLKSIDYTWVFNEDKTDMLYTPIPGAKPTFPEKAVPETPVEAPVEEKPKKVKTRKARTKKQKAPPEVETPVERFIDPEIIALIPEVMTSIVGDTPALTPGGFGFKLLIGCTLFKASSVITMSTDDILAEALKVAELAAGKSVTEIEHFALLQGIEAQIPEIAQALSSSGAWVVSFQPTKGTALDRLVGGLRQYADMVIVNIGM